MGNRLNQRERALRIKWKEALLLALRQHPNGATTAELTEATGVTKHMAMRLLAVLAQDGLIGQTYRIRASDSNKIAYWYPDAGRGMQKNPGWKRRQKENMAPDFKPYQNADAEQIEWNQKVVQRSKQPKFNPWGPL